MIGIIQKARESMINQRNYEEFSKNPSLFIENAILQQNALLRMIKTNDLKLSKH